MSEQFHNALREKNDKTPFINSGLIHLCRGFWGQGGGGVNGGAYNRNRVSRDGHVEGVKQ